MCFVLKLCWRTKLILFIILLAGSVVHWHINWGSVDTVRFWGFCFMFFVHISSGSFFIFLSIIEILQLRSEHYILVWLLFFFFQVSKDPRCNEIDNDVLRFHIYIIFTVYFIWWQFSSATVSLRKEASVDQVHPFCI
jgi:hypothetical protein